MIYAAQAYLFLALHLLVLGLCVFGLVDALRRPAGAFTSAGKRTKRFWTVVLGVASAVAFVATPFFPGGGFGGTFLALISAVAGIVYLVDVKPAVAPYSGGPRRPGGGSSW